MDELSYLSATDALARFRSKTLSPTELLESLISRVDEVDGGVNAIADQLFDQARRDAKAATELYASRPDAARPLEGLPVAAKAEQPLKGRGWSDGSLAYADRMAERTHPVLERIAAAGGVIHVRTTTPEFSCAAFTHSKLWGVTRNPWNLHYSPGGSSGGSGAALAAGMTPLATGSDIGGSIRIPAAFCGVVGFKPPHGRVPDLPPFNLDPYCHVGPMARTVADCALLQNVIAGPHPIDAHSLRPLVMVPTKSEDIAKMRIALAVNLGDWAIEPEVEANTRAVAEALREEGALVEEIEIGITRDEVDRAAVAHFSTIFGRAIAEEVAWHGELLTPYARHFAERFNAGQADATFLEGMALEAAIYAKVAPLLEHHEALICPTAGFPALVAGEDYIEGGIVVAGEEVDPMRDSIMTLAFNILGNCPVLAVPSGWAANGVPTGVQIVGRTFDDATVFRVGMALERARPWGYRDLDRVPTFTVTA